MRKQQDYSIGLDIGVGSVGWACINPEFGVLKHQGRYAIGTREFVSAKTAEERRIQRGTRRRYNRRKRRIQLLQQTIEPLLQNEVSFFRETEELEKHFWRNSNEFRDRTLSQTLKSINENPKKYPTIYHLRHALISEGKKLSPQLIYLALHHLTKFRGHFLNENMSWQDGDTKDSINEQIKTYFEMLADFNYGTNITNEDYDVIEKILMETDLTKSDKTKEILKIVGKEFDNAIKLLVGLSADMSKLFSESDHAVTYANEKLKMAFTNEDITEVYEKLQESERALIDYCNQVYQNISLNDLLGKANYVSEAKVNDYNQFNEDLKWLKSFYNTYFDEKKYREFFITSRYNWQKYHEKKDAKHLCKLDQFIYAKKGYEESFYKLIEKDVEEVLKKEKIDEYKKSLNDMKLRMARNDFLKKQKTYLNAAIPHQNNVYEAEQILKKQQQYYPEITEEMILRVKQIISFRIPYYIGPLVKNEEQSEYAWLIRKKDGVPVLPWNVDEVVNRSESAEKFIERMTNYCMYLLEEKVLPKNSLLYEKFEVLNELNGIQIRSELEQRNNKYRLTAEEKLWIIENVFSKRKNISLNFLQDSLKKSEKFKVLIIDKHGERLKEIYGTQKENGFSTTLSSHIDMTKIFGEITPDNFNMIEEIIYWITVFEDKNIIKDKLKEKYPSVSQKQTEQLLRLNYNGWGRLSKKLLDELPTSHGRTILDTMLAEPLVFMEILSDERFQLDKRIAEINKKDNSQRKRITYKEIEDLQGSPALKKSIWQAVLIVEELVDIFGEPKHIMIEFAREEGDKRRTEDRKKKIDTIRKSLTKNEKELKDFLREQVKYDIIKFQENRFYLYVTQEGKCLYSGRSLDLNKLHEYHVDHIFPRSFVPDDSIDNLALVTSEMNAAKSGTKMPLETIPNDKKYVRKMHWQKLFDNGLISQKKHSRLLKESFTEQDKESFFARQLVETRQITKHVRNILQERFQESEIHTVNAEIVSKLRSHSNVYKIRELNNKHHAVDGFLSALVVQFILNKYGKNFLSFDFKYQEARKKWRHMLTQYGKNFFLFSDIDKYDKFYHYKTGELISGREYLYAINNEIPWQTTKKIGTEEAAFYKQTIHSPKAKAPKYESDKSVHGVYDEMKTESTYLISYSEENKKGKVISKSEFVDFYVIEKYKMKNKSVKELAMYLAGKIAKGKVVDAKIHRNIQKFQLVEVKGFPFYYISSKELHNAKQLNLDKEVYQKLSKIYLNVSKEIIEDNELRNLFNEIGQKIIEEYDSYLPESRKEVIRNYATEVKNQQTFNKAITELFKTTSASAARSQIFGHRYQNKVSPADIKFINQSVTGMKRRKPQSFRHELWSL